MMKGVLVEGRKSFMEQEWQSLRAVCVSVAEVWRKRPRESVFIINNPSPWLRTKGEKV